MRLFSDRFIPIVQKLLQGRNIRVDNITVCTVGQTLLHELRTEGRVTQALADLYDRLVGPNEDRMEELCKTSVSWSPAEDCCFIFFLLYPFSSAAREHGKLL